MERITLREPQAEATAEPEPHIAVPPERAFVPPEPEAPREPQDLDALRYSYEDLAKRWGVSHWTIRNWARQGGLGPPRYLSAVKVRFSLRMIEEFERSRPTSWSQTQD